MRLASAASASFVAATLLLALPPAATAAAAGQDAFGSGEVAFTQYTAPDLGGNLLGFGGTGQAGEPTIGIPWNSNSVFFQAFTSTYRVTFDDATDGNASWQDVTPTYQAPINVDPMLHADPDTGRIWAGGLHGPCSVMVFSDDDGATWLPAGNMCSGANFDHQTIGSGPSPLGIGTGGPETVTAYYCGQAGTTACATSLDGGMTWGPPVQVLGDCGGLHGHIRVSPVSATAVLPHKDCNGAVGFAYSETGVAWLSRTIPDVQSATGFDPSAQFTRASGWLYFGLGNGDGAFIGLSKDEGLTWESIGGGMLGADNATHWLDVGQFHEPPIVRAAFSDVQAGDDDRVAFAFLGLEDLDGDGRGDEYQDIHQCDDEQDDMVWHYYVATSFDAGNTWTVAKATPDPVQIGGIWPFGGGEPCRNLLDFNDMDLDSEGRIVVGFADGCIHDCIDNPALSSSGARSDHATVLRQTSGPGLFATFDTAPGGNEQPEATQPADANGTDTPGPGLTLLLAGLVGLALARRHE